MLPSIHPYITKLLNSGSSVCIPSYDTHPYQDRDDIIDWCVSNVENNGYGWQLLDIIGYPHIAWVFERQDHFYQFGEIFGYKGYWMLTKHQIYDNKPFIHHFIKNDISAKDFSFLIKWCNDTFDFNNWILNYSNNLVPKDGYEKSICEFQYQTEIETICMVKFSFKNLEDYTLFKLTWYN